MNYLEEKYKHWKYKNTALLVASIVFFVYLFNLSFIKALIENLGSLGYLGAFLAGMFFVSIFTVAPATLILFYLSENIGIMETSILAGLGGVLGDFIIIKSLKEGIFEELQPLFEKFAGERMIHLFKTPYFGQLSLILGFLIIASPLPNEAGLALIGFKRIKTKKILILTFLLNVLGVASIILLARYGLNI